MGFIDTGIDYLHTDFLDTAGKTRIAFIWDHSLPANSNTPAPYTYGQEFTAADIDGSACTQVAADGHGTYVAGVGAGNGLATGTNKGVAPDADIIMVKYDFSSSAPGRIADAVAYIFAKAALIGKPCVINASLGDYYGSHDGRDLEAQAIKNLITTQPGQLMVGAIGNFGNRPYHLGYTATSDTNFTWFKFDNALGSFIPGLGVYIQAWGDSADMKNIQFSIGADANKATYSYVGNTAYKFIPAILNQSFYDTLKNAQGIQQLPFDGTLNLTQLTDAIQKVPGVINPVIDSAFARPISGSYLAIDKIVGYNAAAGHMVIDPGFPLTTQIQYF